MMPPNADTRALAAAATVAASILLVVPPHAYGKALAIVSAAATLFWLYNHSDSDPRRSVAQGSASQGSAAQGSAHKRYASVDPELYTLRVPSSDGSPSFPRKHLASRKKLAAIVRKAVRLGTRNGNSASGEKAESALEDFFARYHRALLSADPEFAARTLAVLRDTRSVALNALSDLTLAVPTSLSDSAMLAIDVARDETLRCMSMLSAKHAASGSPALSAAAALWRSPAPHDPGRIVGRQSALY